MIPKTGTISSPWATLAYAVSHATSGDIIHINAGSYTISSQISVPAGISIEGDGNTTVLNSTVSSDYTLLLSSGTQGTNGNQHISNLKMSGGSGLNSYSAYSPVEVIMRSNVYISNCTFQYFSYRGPRFAGSTSTQPSTYSTGNSFHDNTVLDCCNFVGLGDPSGSGQGCLEIGGQQGMLVYNNTITVPYRTGGLNGYDIKYCMDGYNKGLKIYNNIMTRPPYSGLSNDFCFTMELWNCRGGIEIYGNTMTGAIDIGGDDPAPCNDAGGYGFAAEIHNNIIGFDSYQVNEQIGIDIERAQTGGMYIYNNYFKYLSSPIHFLQGWDSRAHDIVENIYIYSNVTNNVGYTSAHYGSSFIAVGHLATDASPNIIYRSIYVINNTAYRGSGGAGTESFITLTIAGTGSYFYIQNNIVVGFGLSVNHGVVGVDGTNLISLNHITYQNNLAYQNFNNGWVNYYGSSESFDVNSGNIAGDPKFVSTSDFHLQSGSPAIGKGVHITTPSIPADVEGSAINNPPEIGAYKSGSSVTQPAVPVYQSSAVANATPSLLEMTYNMTLAGTVPAASSFNVIVNSLTRAVSSIVISGSKVQLTLATAVKSGDLITVTYTKPATNQLQSPTGGAAINISSQSVTNNLVSSTKDATSLTATMAISPNHIHNILNVLLTYSITPTAANSPEIIQITDLSGNLLIKKLLVTGVTNILIPLNVASGIYNILISAGGSQIASQKIIVY